MTAAGSEGPAASVDDDPFASKISPDDPRLSIDRPPSRTLKTKPMAAIAFGLVAAGVLALKIHSNMTTEKTKVTREPHVNERSAIPDFLQSAPSSPKPVVKEVPKLNPLFDMELAGDFDDSPPIFRASPPPPPSTPPPLVAPAPIDQAAARAQGARERLDEQALAGELFFSTGQRSASRSQSPQSQPPGATVGHRNLSPSAAPVVGSGAAEWDPNLQGRKNDFVDNPRPTSSYLAATLQPPLSPFELKATSIIPVTLITGINSDLPGPIIAQVRERVFDTVTGRHLLIPQGARLLASYDSMVAWGQERVLMCWSRLIFPNGKSIDLDCMPAADLIGQAGLTDEVDNHWSRLLAAAGLSTVLALGTRAAAGNPSGFQPTIAQSAAESAAGQINSIGQSFVQRQLSIQPTITVRPGFPANVIVTRDLVLEPYVD